LHFSDSAIFCSIEPEEFKLIITGTFIFKVLPCTGDGRGDTFSRCDLFEMWVLFTGIEEQLAG
jgi:hypothetical protein